MGTNLEETYVQTLQDDIKLACKTLEELGYESLMVIVSKDRHMELGSATGRNFIKENPDYFQDFILHCQIKKENTFQSAYESAFESNHDADLNKSKKWQVKVPTVIIGPGKKKASKSPLPKKRERSSEDEHFSDTEQIAAEANDSFDDYDEGDESGLEEESEIDQTEAHTIDTNKMVKYGGRLRNSKKTNIKKQKVIVRPAFEGTIKKDGKSRRTFHCDQCDKVYLSKKALIIHQRKHTGETPYPCLQCGKAFRSSSLLGSHKVSHITDLRYTCDKCGKGFSWRGSFHTHQRNVHATERRHVCDICGSSFKDRGVLKRHKLRHTGQKDYSCEMCGKAFLFPYLLKEHQKTHYDVPVVRPKNFCCGICSQRFTAKKSVMKHQKRKHPHHVPVIHMIKDSENDEMSE